MTHMAVTSTSVDGEIVPPTGGDPDLQPPTYEITRLTVKPHPTSPRPAPRPAEPSIGRRPLLAPYAPNRRPPFPPGTPTNDRNRRNSRSVELQTRHEISKELCLSLATGPPPIGCQPSLTRAMATGPPISKSPAIAQLVPLPAIAQRSRRRSFTSHHYGELLVCDELCNPRFGFHTKYLNKISDDSVRRMMTGGRRFSGRREL
ncbi:hypothetical protein TIFTF001_002155 [Ficus carica]|uniref:Uncharacterized protein n=1 Tax=Ficus carica TaxID=3494 RepID=A0AA87Z3G9_FICCA|nr:hypothetical protein TIFTF001_002155 [Ficus carica]